jgi:hypothetical protein
MMRGWLIIAFIFPLLAGAQKFSAADLRLLRSYSTGVFSNNVQAKADTHFIQSMLKVQPLWQKRKDGIWLFIEKTDTGHRYQVWHLYLQDDTTVLMQFLDFKENQQAVQLSRDMKQQSGLRLNNLLIRQGCEGYLKKDKMRYTATSKGKDCLANRAGIEYLTYTITFTKNSLEWQETGFNKDDKPLTGSAYNFIKQVTPLK